MVSAGEHQTIEEGETVTLVGSGSDAEGQDLGYSWVQTGGPAVILDDPNAASPTFDAPEGLANSDITFSLTVSDGTNSSVDTVSVTVNADNDAPSAEAGSAQSVDEGDTVTLAGSGTDPEGQSLTYTWVQTGGPAVVLDDASAAAPTFDAPEGLANSDITFELTVSDGTNSSVDTVAITVNADNDSPSANAGPAQIVDEGDAVQLAGSGTDPEGQSLTYTWVQTGGPTVVLDDANAAAPSFEAPEGISNSDIRFSLTVSDGTNSSVDTVTVTVNADNDAPTAFAGNLQTVNGGQLVELGGSGSDPENTDLTFFWRQVSGPVVILDDPTSTNPTYTAPAEGGEVKFELEVSDGANTSVSSVSIIGTPQNFDLPDSEANDDQNDNVGEEQALVDAAPSLVSEVEEGSAERPNLASLFSEVTEAGAASAPSQAIDLPQDLTDTDFTELYESRREVVLRDGDARESARSDSQNLSRVSDRSVGQEVDRGESSTKTEAQPTTGFLAGLFSLIRGVAGTTKVPNDPAEKDPNQKGQKR